MVDDFKTGLKMPKTISEAILSVSEGLNVLVKMKDNSFERYNFASIDDFMAHVRKPCHEHGLSIIQNENTPPVLQEMKSKKGTPLMMWFASYSFYLVHKEGDMFGPINRTVMVQANGAQAAGSAQSYAWKQFVRSTFMLPTSDKDDPDMTATNEISHANNVRTDMQKQLINFKDKLQKKKSMQEANEYWDEHGPFLDELKKVSAAGYKHICEVHAELTKSFEGKD